MFWTPVPKCQCCMLTFEWQKTEVGGPAVTSTANSYSFCTTHTALRLGASCSACSGCPLCSGPAQ